MVVLQCPRRWCYGVLVAMLMFFGVTGAGPTESRAADEVSDEEATQIKAAERFLTVLEKNPRRGTALDRVYGHHVEFGTLDKFIAGLNAKTAADAKDGTSWMLLGLFESQRGRDGEAVDAFRQAETHRPTDAMASFYLAQSLLRIGQNEDAILAFERAIGRKPQRNDMLEIFQQLGRVHQRAQRTEEALKVWTRLEALFPDDPRVLEQIAVILAEEGDNAQALIRYERLAKLVKDDYRKTMCLIAVAELKIKIGQKDNGILDLENVLGELDPDSWIYKDIRRRIDDVFLRSGDQDSLVKYYQKWLDAHPEDVEGMARLAKFLAQSARIPEATQWMEKALKLAPSRTDLRKSFIDQLVDDQRVPEAIKQYEQLAIAAPGNLDFLRDWGKLVLKDKSQDLEVRKKEAVRIWKQIVANRPDDAITTAQVADLFRQSNLHDEAMAMYQKAVTLAPADPQYREYLGEFYHIQKQTDEALKTWGSIAEGKLHTAENVARLAEVYNSFGYLDQAVKEIADACKLAPREFVLQMRSAEYHARATKYDDALTFLDAAEKLAASEDDRDALIRQRIEVFQSSQRIEDEIKKLVAAIEGNTKVTPADWAMLARYYEANRQWVDAMESVENGLAIDAKSVPTLTVAARISESSGNYGQAAAYSRRLADTDRRSRGDHLMNVARLEAQMGRSDEAMAAANELIMSAPGNTDNYEFLAQMCFRLGKSDEGLEALRKAVRINPNEPHLIMALASALADQLRTDEAIEVYWRAFDKSETIDDKTSLTQKLVPLYEQINQLDKLIERFERDRREEEKRREMTICLAQAWQTSGDLGTARQELEQLLGEDSRDTNLLQQLAKLCEASGDTDAAIGYQRQLIAVAPGHETEFPLVAMLQSRGDRDEAMEILVRLTSREEDPVRLLRSIDSLLNQGAFEAVISITEPLLSQQREDWELLYREGVAWAKLEKSEEAATRFDRILTLTIPHDTLGLFANDEFKRAQAKAKSENLKGNQTQGPTKRSPLQLLSYSSQIQSATGLISEEYYGGNSRQQTWTPREYGTARMASFAWKLKFEDDAKQRTPEKPADPGIVDANTTDDASENVTSVAPQVAAKAQADGAHRNAIYDWLYVASLKGEQAVQFQIARDLAKSGGQEEEQFFLNSLRTRHVNPAAVRTSNGQNAAPAKTALSDEDLTLMLKCVEDLSREADKKGEDQSFGQQIAYDGQGNAYVNIGGQWVMIGGGMVGGGKQFTMQVVEELKLAKRDAEADARLNELYTSAKTASELSGVISVMLQQETLDKIPEFFERWVAAAKDELAKPPEKDDSSAASTRSAASARRNAMQLAQTTNSLMQWIGRLGAEEENARILSILDQALDVATIENKKRLAEQAAAALKSRRSSSAASTGRTQTSLQWIYGKQSTYIQQVEVPSRHVDSSVVLLLRDVHEVLKRNDVLPDLTTLLKARVKAAAPEDATVENAYLATELWWSDEQDEAVEILVKLGEAQKDDPSARFELADLRMQRGDIEDALEIVDSIIARDQKLLQRRELMALTLAERIGDNERARSAAERLFGLRLDAATQLSLVAGMRRLGMNDMADAVIARTERQSSNQPPALASLMMLYQSQGKADRAKQLAHILLRKTVSPMTTMANATRNPMRYNTTTDSSRTQALAVLQQTGELKTLITQLESQLERSPESPKLYEQLIEFYGISGQKDKVGPLLEKAIANRPDAFALRLQLAKYFEQTNKLTEACDQYLELLKRKPDWITEDLYTVRRVFTQAQRTTDLVAAIRSMNFKSIRQPYYIINLVGELMQDEKNTDVAVELIEQIIVSFPNYRSNILSEVGNSNNAKVWQNERMFQIGKKLVLPTALDLQNSPWSGLNQIYSRSGNGDVTSQFHYMLRGLNNSDKLKELRSAIQETVDATPGWFGGEAMLALIDLQSGDKDAATVRLEALANNEAAMKSIPSDSCWLIGQELDKSEKTRPLALMLFEKAVTTVSSSSSSNQLQYSPIQKLIKAFSENGRKTEARDLLLKTVKAATFNDYDAQYSSYQRTENSLFAAGKLLEMQYPVDAVQMYRNLLDNEETLRTVSQYNSNNADQYVNQAKAGLTKAMSSLDSADATAAIVQLLAVSEMPKDGVPLLDLMPIVPSVASISTEHIDSGLIRLLVTLAKDEKVKTAIDARLEALQQEHPTDATAALALAAFRGQMKDERFVDSVKALATIVSDQPLEEVGEGRRPNSRQRKVAALAVPLWMVAREALKDESLKASATLLADRALAGARRQTGLQNSAGILMEWSSWLLEAGNKAAAEEKLTELLRISTERPTRKAKSKSLDGATGRSFLPERSSQPRCDLRPIKVPFQNQAAGDSGFTFCRADVLPVRLIIGTQATPPLLMSSTMSGRGSRQVAKSFPAERTYMTTSLLQPPQITPPTQTVPPLTISQFRVAMIVAETAAKNGMANLSRDAVKEAMQGGTPVPDPVTTPVATNGRVVRSSSVVPASGDPLEAEVVASMQRVIEKWQGDDYPPADVYTLLKPLVFPSSRPADILLFADNTKLRAAQAKSLGVTLVEWAKKADQIADLRTLIDARKGNQAAMVPALVLLTQVDLSIDDESAAVAHLTELAAAMLQAPNPAAYQLACHAALPAADKKALEDAAYAVLKTAVQMPWTTPDRNRNNLVSETGKLDEMVNRYLAKSGDIEGVRKYFEAQQVASQADAARYGGDYGLYKQWNDLGRFATEAARNGIPSIAADFIGRAADFDAKQYSPPNLAFPLAIVANDFAKLPPQQRYEAWRDWTMPTQDRRTVRCVADWVPNSLVPEVFVPADAPSRQRQHDPAVCNLSELIAAAREAGRLEELSQLAKKEYDEKLTNAEFLWMLIQIETSDRDAFEPLFQQFFDLMPERRKERTNRSAFPDYLVAQECLRSDKLHDIAVSYGKQKLRKPFQDTGGAAFVSHIETEFADCLAKKFGSRLEAKIQTQLSNWVPQAIGNSDSAVSRELWLGHDNLISHYSGSGRDTLYLKWPLTGDFEFHVDCLEKHWGECDAGYGGVIVASNTWGSSGSIVNFTGEDSITRPAGMKRGIPSFDHITIQSRDGMMRYLNNGRLVYEEKLTGSVPWIVLTTEGSKMSVFRNPRLAGMPTIPREVELVSEDGMPGWSSGGFAGSTPSPRILAEKVTDENSSTAYRRREAATEPDWSVKSGVLHGKENALAAPDVQGVLFYCRPLLDGETFQYEFFREANRVVSHPSLGRLAFMIEPDGVKTHWISLGTFDHEFRNIKDDNSVVESEYQRGPKSVPLKEGDWNQVTMSHRENQIEINLNGELIFARPIPQMDDFRPGFFRYVTAESRIRNVTLSGAWPETTDLNEMNAQLMDLTEPLTAGDRRLINSMMPEEFDELHVPELLATTKTLPAADAYALLKKWVLPGDDHDSMRLAWQSASIDPETDAAFRTAADLQSPALELVRLAGELNRVEELTKDIDAILVANDLDKRNKQAMKALLAMQGADVAATTAAMREVHATLYAGLPQSLTLQQRAAELLVVWKAMQNPKTLPWAIELGTKLCDVERDEKRRSNDDRFHRLAHGLVGRLDLAMRANSDTSGQEKLTQWTSVPYLKPDRSFNGQHPSHWTYSRGVLRHHPSEMWSQLFFQSPLRGKFEIEVNRSTYGYKEVAITWGMHSAEPRHDAKAVKVVKLMQSSNDIEQELNLPAWEVMAGFKIVVDGPKVTTFTNGVQIHEENLAGTPSPWIVLQSHNPTDEAIVQNLRIIGTPEIPDQIDLIDMSGWGCWRADIYGEWHVSTTNDEVTPWQKVGDELVGKKKNAVGPTESLMLYQRPMLEDGEIEFETFYVPGEQEVHPAVGKSAILLQPDGAKLHTLTEAQYDPRDLAPDNAAVIVGAAATIDLKPNDWNKVKLTLKGDQLTITVNGTAVASHTVTERRNERFFGLFRYSNQTQCRVRNLVYRGDWPKTLPAVDDQQLATPPHDVATSAGDGFDTQVIPLNGTPAQFKAAGWSLSGFTNNFAMQKDGLQFQLNLPTKESTWAGINTTVPIIGDCEVTLDYRDLAFIPVKEGWGQNLELLVTMDDPMQSRIECGMQLTGPGSPEFASKTIRKSMATGEPTYHHAITRRGERPNGRLRIVRNGDEVICLFAETGSDTFLPFNTFTVGAYPIKEIGVYAHRSDLQGEVSVKLESLTVRVRTGK